MTDTVPRFSAFELVVATITALLVQVGLLLLLRTSGGTTLQADLSDDNARPMSVAITPMLDDAPLLKLGSKKQPNQLPDRWLAPRPVPRTVATATPSPLAKATPQAIPTTSVSDAGVKPPPNAEIVKQTDLAVSAEVKPAPVSTIEGAADGVKEGTETDPLKARQVDLYKVRLNDWFSNRFAIRGKLSWNVLKDLSANVVVTVSDDRTVAGFTITRPSGNAVFDETLQSSLAAIQASGVDLPPPPEAYPDVLKVPLKLKLLCNVKSRCE